MDQIKKNTVPSQMQLSTENPVFFVNKDGKGIRILFAGNSITLHGFKPEIGWYGVNYGMAASSKENDYVHLVMEEVYKKHPDAAICICQCAEWERNYKNGSEILPTYKEARDFNADIIVVRLIENCKTDHFDSNIFIREYKELIDYLDAGKTSKIILTTGFWKHPADELILKIGQEREYSTLYLGELGEDESMKAIGLFNHTGVANHPGDKGMKYIADMIIETLQQII